MSENIEWRLWREDLSQSNVPPTGYMEELLPGAMSSLLSHVDHEWLRTQESNHVRLNRAYLNSPVSFIGTTRVEFDVPAIHFYARALLGALDFLGQRPNYDFHFGTMVVPELAKLGQILPIVLESAPGAQAKVKSLYTGPSSEAPSTMYELLVAGACIQKGRSIRFETSLPGKKKTSDLRVLDKEGFVIECKRRRMLFDYEKREEKIARSLFSQLRGIILNAGLAGILEAEFILELEKLDEHDLLKIFSNLVTGDIGTSTARGSWGNVTWYPLPPNMSVPRTRLYSPKFISHVYKWPTVPTHDGIICQVESPTNLVSEIVHKPFCLKWSSTSETALLKKSRAISGLFSDATQQVGVGENGVIYICYNESSRADIADQRTKLMAKQFGDWWHSSKVRIPLAFVNRLYAIPMPNGAPDLIENVVKWQADYANPDLLKLFPAVVFTNVI